MLCILKISTECIGDVNDTLYNDGTKVLIEHQCDDIGVVVELIEDVQLVGGDVGGGVSCSCKLMGGD